MVMSSSATRSRTSPHCGAHGPDGTGLSEEKGPSEIIPRLAQTSAVVAQIAMLIAMLAERRWMFALMVAPGVLGSLTATYHRLRRRPRLVHDAGPTDISHSTAMRERADDSVRRRFESVGTATLESLMGVESEPETLLWRCIVRNWIVPQGLSCPVGTDRDGAVRIDLKSSGPHALVAGTTGSGKSVLLQNWCLALAAGNPPDRVQFVFMDFKGGSAFNHLEALPHTVGNVCDLNLRHAARALLAVEAELRRRERMVSDGRVSCVDDLESPPASLVIVVDEFHALRSQLEGYVDRLVRIASLGRSLGMHLIICTQNPLGQVSAEMKANIGINICLRVRDPMQSRELLGTIDAASISPRLPGAAYCDDGEEIRAMRCCPAVDASRLSMAIRSAHRFHGLPAPAPLFSVPLPRVAHPGHAPHGGIRRGACPPQEHRVEFGLLDDGMSISPATLTLGRGNIAVIGLRGRGKTSLLRNLARMMSALGGITVTADDNQWRPSNATGVWLLDDADDLFDPFGSNPLSHVLHSALADPRTTVVFGVETSKHLRIPEHCTTRIVFPTGERSTDLMNSIPAALLASCDHDDFSVPGRAVLIHADRANMVQCFAPEGPHKKPVRGCLPDAERIRVIP
ncbi:MAG: FtsK/SpoIIIE domain-containing protein [Bifidobacterium sp.]|jgi:S-DNA-T family DNA segregation ATPase FtsK/SpoIIIE